MKQEFRSEKGIVFSYCSSFKEEIGKNAALYFYVNPQSEKVYDVPKGAVSISLWCEGRELWEEDVCRGIAELCHTLCEEYHGDENRMYVLGALDGATGIWTLLSLYPRLFAAACPISGYGDPYAIRVVKATKIWTFYRSGEEPESPSGGIVKGNKMMLAGCRNMALSLRGQGHLGIRETVYDREDPEEILNSLEVKNWLLEQDRRNQLEVEFIRPGLWDIEDYFHSSAYLLEGTEKALLIDTCMPVKDDGFYRTVMSLTKLPVEVVITHHHPDHDGNISMFRPVYLHENDIKELLADYQTGYAPENKQILPCNLKPLHDGDVFDLGGGIKVRTVELFGHTPGSVVFLCDKLNLVFTGDAVGSGEVVLLFGEEGRLKEGIENYQKQLARFLKELDQMDDPLFFGGHRYQDSSCDHKQWEMVYSGGVSYYNPLCRQIVEDKLALCGEILADRIKPKELVNGLDFRYRRAAILYLYYFL